MIVFLILLLVWLGSGWLFALEHGYLDEDSCSTGWDNAVAVLLGPISYAATDPGWGLCVVPL